MKLFIASDHAGFALKQKLLESKIPVTGGTGFYEWADLGPSDSKSVDYPDFAEKLARSVKSNDLGVLICGSGIGMSIAANKVAGIRAAHVSDPVSAKLAREHNHANVLCLGARFSAPEYALELVQQFLNAKPSTEGRHAARVEKIAKLEN